MIINDDDDVTIMMMMIMMTIMTVKTVNDNVLNEMVMLEFVLHVFSLKEKF